MITKEDETKKEDNYPNSVVLLTYNKISRYNVLTILNSTLCWAIYFESQTLLNVEDKVKKLCAVCFSSSV